MALTNIEERIERSIFEVIRLRLVSEGYLPNKKSYTKNDAGALAYQAAITAIKNSSKKFCIQVFGMSSPQAKGETQVPRIIVQTQRPLPGDLGTPITSIEVIGNKYEKFRHPYSSVDIQIDIKIVWNTANQLRVAAAIISETLSQRGYIDFYDTSPEKFYIEQINAGYDIKDAEQGVTETVLSYVIKDLYTTGDIKIVDNGPLITSIEVEILDPVNNIENLNIN